MKMEQVTERRVSRRRLQTLALALPAPLAIAVLAGKGAGIGFAQTEDTAGTATPAGTPVLAPTPACADADDLETTLDQTEGPYFTPDSPERTSLREEGIAGTPLFITGYVYGTNCQPVAEAQIEFWQADDEGVYDLEGYTLRGHQFTDAAGRYELETIVPGLYPGRTRHIHVKVQAPDGPTLTTQLYFPDTPENEEDNIYDPSLEIDLEETEEERRQGYFTFVVAPS